MTALASQRAAEIEIMDSGGYGPEEISGNLADLRFYNTWFGGTRAIVRGVRRVAAAAGAQRRLTILDVATGTADIPLALARWGTRRGVEVFVEGLDSNADMLHEAIRHGAEGAGAAQPSLVQADATCLPHADRSVDVVVCSNFLHHLTAQEARLVLAEMRRVCRLGVVAVDLVRSREALLTIWLLTRLTTANRLTRNDGPLSVRRAFTPSELSDLAEEAGLAGAVARASGPVRMSLTWRRATSLSSSAPPG